MVKIQLITIFLCITLMDFVVGKPIEKSGFQLVCPGDGKECIVTGQQNFDDDKMIQGDIIPDPQQSTDSRNALMDPLTRWPKKTVPYAYHHNFTDKEKQIIESGMRFIESKTCIKFVPYDPKLKFNAVLLITNAAGCKASLGYAKGQRILNLSPSQCLVKNGIVHHEMLHVLGLKHEHSRPDRDEYVTIIQENIAPGQEHNFEKASPLEYTTYDIPYNYLSVMHYPINAFSIDPSRVTLLPKGAVNIKLMGQRVKATNWDLKKINLMYKCTEKN
uniref:Metalloendopeptidase n=1 Tax=Oncocephalus sp. TaxID=2944721 RepID=A0AB38ZEJ4_9HEMI